MAHKASPAQTKQIAASEPPVAYRVNATCRLLGVTRTTLYRWAKNGDLKLVRLGPNTSGVTRASLEAWAAARGLEL